MTAYELQRIALRLSNSCWCRHWLNYNHPNNPRQMAIQCMDYGKWGGCDHVLGPKRVDDLLKLGFTEDKTDGVNFCYLIDRTNPDGTPYNGTI